MNRFDSFEKNKVSGQFKIKHNKNNRIIVGQWTIAEDVSLQLYLVIV